MAISGTIKPSWNIVETKSLDLSTPRDALSLSETHTITDGTGADQFDEHFHDTRPIAAGANDDLDLAGGLTDAFGNTITFSAIKALQIINSGTVEIQIDQSVANGFTAWFTGIQKIPAGGTLQLVAPTAAGYAVTAGTGDILRITNNDGSTAASYKIAIGGIDGS